MGNKKTPLQQYSGNAKLDANVGLILDHLETGGFVLLGKDFADALPATVWKEITAKYTVVFPADVLDGKPESKT
jgi:hypothetical protein